MASRKDGLRRPRGATSPRRRSPYPPGRSVVPDPRAVSAPAAGPARRAARRVVGVRREARLRNPRGRVGSVADETLFRREAPDGTRRPSPPGAPAALLAARRSPRPRAASGWSRYFGTAELRVRRPLTRHSQPSNQLPPLGATTAASTATTSPRAASPPRFATASEPKPARDGARPPRQSRHGRDFSGRRPDVRGRPSARRGCSRVAIPALSPALSRRFRWRSGVHCAGLGGGGAAAVVASADASVDPSMQMWRGQ